MDNIIFIDTSFVIFYRFYALIRWIRMSNPDIYETIENIKEYVWKDNKIFMEKYNKTFLEKVLTSFDRSELKNYKLIFCIDDNCENTWRYKLYNNYKLTRRQCEKKYNYSGIFEYTLNILLPNIIKENKNYYSVKIDNIESDDIIGCSISYYKKKLPNTNFYIFSNDKDFLQLGGDNITFVSFNYRKKITEKEAYDSLREKILYGDKSDNIKSIFKPGNKIKKKDLLNEDILKKYLEIKKEFKDHYILNSILIDFKNIPTEYSKIIIEKIKNIIQII